MSLYGRNFFKEQILDHDHHELLDPVDIRMGFSRMSGEIFYGILFQGVACFSKPTDLAFYQNRPEVLLPGAAMVLMGIITGRYLNDPQQKSKNLSFIAIGKEKGSGIEILLPVLYGTLTGF